MHVTKLELNNQKNEKHLLYCAQRYLNFSFNRLKREAIDCRHKTLLRFTIRNAILTSLNIIRTILLQRILKCTGTRERNRTVSNEKLDRAGMKRGTVEKRRDSSSGLWSGQHQGSHGALGREEESLQTCLLSSSGSAHRVRLQLVLRHHLAHTSAS